MTVSYSQFEGELLIATVEAADANSRGQVDMAVVAESVLPGVNENWIWSAVRAYERLNLVYNVSRPLQGPIVLMVTGEGRQRADAVKASIAQTQQPSRKIRY
jgi:hypothetical protein